MRHLFPTIFVCFTLACGAPQVPSPEVPLEPDDRLDSCRDALTQDAELPAILVACSPMWRQPSCSAAWTQSLKMRGIAGAEHIISSCKQAYCSKPEHAICMEKGAVDLTDEEVDWLWLWTDLNTAILRKDLDDRVEAPEAGQFAKLLLNRVIFQETVRK